MQLRFHVFTITGLPAKSLKFTVLPSMPMKVKSGALSPIFGQVAWGVPQPAMGRIRSTIAIITGINDFIIGYLL
jgi:hypothetical protein